MTTGNRKVGEAALIFTVIFLVGYALLTGSRKSTNTTTIIKVREETGSCGFSRPTEFQVEVYKKQSKERRERLALIKNEADNDQGFAYLYNNLAPEAFCAEKMKVGTTDDGGKWMCSPQRLPKDCIIYALGISGVTTFERDIQEYSQQRCKIIAVDQNKQSDEVIKTLEDINSVVVQATIGPEDNGSTRTLKSILEEKGVDQVEILKIDIEGAELNTMEAFLDNYQPAQIMIEVHGKAAQAIAFLQMVASKGYYLVHYEINGRWHILGEYAFIHESKLEHYHATLMAPFLRS